MSLLLPGHFQRRHFPVNHWQTQYQHFQHFFVKSGPLFQDFKEIEKPISIVHKGQVVLELKARSNIEWLPIKQIIDTATEIIVEVRDLDWILFMDDDLWLTMQ